MIITVRYISVVVSTVSLLLMFGVTPLTVLRESLPTVVPLDIINNTHTYVRENAFPVGLRILCKMTANKVPETVHVHDDLIICKYRDHIERPPGVLTTEQINKYIEDSKSYGETLIISRLSDRKIIFRCKYPQVQFVCLQGVSGVFIWIHRISDDDIGSINVYHIDVSGQKTHIQRRRITSDAELAHCGSVPQVNRFYVNSFNTGDYNDQYVYVFVVSDHGASLYYYLCIGGLVNIKPVLILPNIVFEQTCHIGTWKSVYRNTSVRTTPTSCDWMAHPMAMITVDKRVIGAYETSISDTINSIHDDKVVANIYWRIFPYLNKFMLVGMHNSNIYVRKSTGDYMDVFGPVHTHWYILQYVGESRYGPCMRDEYNVYVWTY